MNIVGFINGIASALVILIMLVLIKRRRGISNYNQLDERQKAVRGSIALHSLIFGGGLLIISGVIFEGTGSRLFTIGTQNLLIIALVSIFFVLESVLRGAYFGQGFPQKRLRLFKILGMVYGLFTALQIVNIVKGKIILIQEGVFTSAGVEFFSYIWVVVLYGLILWGWSRGYKEN
ncbi:hypothetical protein [Lactococcus allomyrinae]|uniref:Uncharacterized protein n=1 Tax=Lactococcus allomyrinae TaxID=2419773 RepID=A0A387BEY4_9LACT|nr:hypothetical protein [Lactococcus allomyrinae]AYG00814.1 hypothetical protein D7I46_06720 [Lactococcus allomyrinae]